MDYRSTRLGSWTDYSLARWQLVLHEWLGMVGIPLIVVGALLRSAFCVVAIGVKIHIEEIYQATKKPFLIKQKRLLVFGARGRNRTGTPFGGGF